MFPYAPQPILHRRVENSGCIRFRDQTLCWMLVKSLSSGLVFAVMSPRNGLATNAFQPTREALNFSTTSFLSTSGRQQMYSPFINISALPQTLCIPCGAARVGCMNCVLCNKEEISETAARWPEHIEKHRQWEHKVRLVSRWVHWMSVGTESQAWMRSQLGFREVSWREFAGFSEEESAPGNHRAQQEIPGTSR